MEEHVRVLSLEDLDKLMELQEHICDRMDNDEWFVPTSREENEKFLVSPNRIFGVFEKEQMIAYGSIGFFELDRENYGWDCEWDEEKVRSCSNLDTIVVHPDFRGRGLQRLLFQTCVDYAREVKKDGIVLTTICPTNIYSLRNAQKEGFEILFHKEMYGGKDRYILGKK